MFCGSLQDAFVWQGGAALQQAASAPWQQPQPASHEQATNGSPMPWQPGQLQEPTPQPWAQAQLQGSARPWLPRPVGPVQAANGSSAHLQRRDVMSQGMAAQPPPSAALQGQATRAPSAAGNAAGSKVSAQGCRAHDQQRHERLR